jgi:hypothetical protein
MSKVKIEDYRTFEINFDTEKEVFYSMSDAWDKEFSNKSYSSAKKAIDEYIKANSEFKPFFIQKKPSHYTEDKKIKINGIRKDGLFTYLGDDGKTYQLSKYNEDEYLVYDPSNETLIKEYNLINAEIKKLDDKKKEVLSKWKGVSLKEYKQQIITQ